MKRDVPEWVIKHKKKGVDIRFINKNYYAYSRHSVWDPKRNRAKTITDKYLGRITQEGMIIPKSEKIFNNLKKASIKEFGASKLMAYLAKDLIDELKVVYPDSWQWIFSIAVQRFFYASPIKNMQTHFCSSSLSDEYPGISMSPKTISDILQSLGADRKKVVDFLKKLMIGSEHLIVDLTAINSQAENATYPAKGYNSHNEFLPQINMLLIFSKDKNRPVYFRMLPGSIVDVTSIELTLEESEIKNAIFIGDKAFYSEHNVTSFKKAFSKYVLPLRRNLSIIDYGPTLSIGKKNFDGQFFFEDRLIWFKDKRNENERVILFLDESLRLDEQKGFIERVNSKNPEWTMEGYHEKEHTFGTIAVITNLELNAEEIYSILKARLHIEQAFDTFKNTLEADRTYMRTDYHLEGLSFINFISLYLYYIIYGHLISNKLLKKFSPKDVILNFSKVHKIKLSDREIITEVPKTVRDLLEKMKLDKEILTLEIDQKVPKPMP